MTEAAGGRRCADAKHRRPRAAHSLFCRSADRGRQRLRSEGQRGCDPREGEVAIPVAFPSFLVYCVPELRCRRRWCLSLDPRNGEVACAKIAPSLEAPTPTLVIPHQPISLPLLEFFPRVFERMKRLKR